MSNRKHFYCNLKVLQLPSFVTDATYFDETGKEHFPFMDTESHYAIITPVLYRDGWYLLDGVAWFEFHGRAWSSTVTEFMQYFNFGGKSLTPREVDSINTLLTYHTCTRAVNRKLRELLRLHYEYIKWRAANLTTLQMFKDWETIVSNYSYNSELEVFCE